MPNLSAARQPSRRRPGSNGASRLTGAGDGGSARDERAPGMADGADEARSARKGGRGPDAEAQRIAADDAAAGTDAHRDRRRASAAAARDGPGATRVANWVRPSQRAATSPGLIVQCAPSARACPTDPGDNARGPPPAPLANL